MIVCRMHTTLMFLILISIISINVGLKIENLDELQGLRFEDIGELKLITKFHALNFQIDISSIRQLISNASEYIDIVKNNYTSDKELVKILEELNTSLYVRKLELEDILFGLIEKKPKKRSKRDILPLFFGNYLTVEHGKQIQTDIQALINASNANRNASNSLIEYSENLRKQLNQTVEELGKRNTIARFIAMNAEVERRINSIKKLLTRERLSGDIISLEEFINSTRNVSQNLTDDEELPYEKVIDYYHNIRVTHKIEKDLIKLEMIIPIVNSSPRQLYKIVELPALNDENLFLTDVGWKFVANNSKSTIKLMSLDSCYHPNKRMFYCELKSTETSIYANDCITNALINSIIDVKLCKTIAVKSKNLTIIHLNDGEYFFYTPLNVTFDITCKLEKKSVDFSPQTIGILELEPGCNAIANEFTLIKTVKYQEAPYIKNEILNIFFDIDEIKENIKKYNTPLTDQFYIESLASFREIKISPIDQKGIQQTFFMGSYGEFVSGGILICVLIILFVAFTFHRLREWFIKNYKVVDIKNEKKKGILK